MADRKCPRCDSPIQRQDFDDDPCVLLACSSATCNWQDAAYVVGRRTSKPTGTSAAEAAGPDRPWSLLLICCGREESILHFATQAEAELFRSGYTDPSSGHDRQAILSGPDMPDRGPGDVLAEYLDVIAKSSGMRQIAQDAQTLLRALLAERKQLLRAQQEAAHPMLAIDPTIEISDEDRQRWEAAFKAATDGPYQLRVMSHPEPPAEVEWEVRYDDGTLSGAVLLDYDDARQLATRRASRGGHVVYRTIGAWQPVGDSTDRSHG